MNRIQVQETIIDKMGINDIQASMVNNLIRKKLKQESDVILDFTGIELVTNAFLKELFEPYSEEPLFSRVNVDPNTLYPHLHQRIQVFRSALNNPVLECDDWDALD